MYEQFFFSVQMVKRIKWNQNNFSVEYIIVSIFPLYTNKFMFEISIQWHSINVTKISLHYCNGRWPEDDCFD
jgi:hypothetical protein